MLWQILFTPRSVEELHSRAWVTVSSAGKSNTLPSSLMLKDRHFYNFCLSASLASITLFIVAGNV
jgi:hypothetical protein